MRTGLGRLECQKYIKTKGLYMCLVFL